MLTIIQKQVKSSDISFEDSDDVQLGSKPPILKFLNPAFQQQKFWAKICKSVTKAGKGQPFSTTAMTCTISGFVQLFDIKSHATD